MPVLTPPVAGRTGEARLILEPGIARNRRRHTGGALEEASRRRRGRLSCPAQTGARRDGCSPALVCSNPEKRTHHQPSAPAPDATSSGATSVSSSGLHSRDEGAGRHVPDSTVATRRPGVFERPSLSLAPGATTLLPLSSHGWWPRR